MTKPLARIAITIPSKDLADADRLARRRDRSRSWIVAEAVRRYVALAEESSAGADSPASLRGTASLPPTAIGLGAARLDQLRRDMALTPEARIREAEETVRLTTVRQKGRPSQLLMFDRFEDYLEWKRRDLA